MILDVQSFQTVKIVAVNYDHKSKDKQIKQAPLLCWDSIRPCVWFSDSFSHAVLVGG